MGSAESQLNSSYSNPYRGDICPPADFIDSPVKIESSSRSYSYDSLPIRGALPQVTSHSILTLNAGPVKPCGDQLDDYQQSKSVSYRKLYNAPYYAKWSMVPPNSVVPEPRYGHFCANCSNGSNLSYVGYGQIDDANYLGTSKIWCFDPENYTWQDINVKGAKISPRTESCAIVAGNLIYIFGGRNQNKYFSDFHTINLNTREVNLVQGSGQAPHGLAGAFIAMYSNKIFIWGGYDGKNTNQILYCYDMISMSWSSKKLPVQARHNAASAVKDNYLYIFGGNQTQSQELIVIDLEKQEGQTVVTTGKGPVSQNHYGRMIAVGNYLFYYGGKAKNTYTMLYALDLIRMWWFLFHIRPDDDSVTTDDGIINETGFFMVPRIHSYGCCYSPKNREIIAFLGYPAKSVQDLFVLSVGDALSVVNLRNDMFDILALEEPQKSFS